MPSHPNKQPLNYEDIAHRMGAFEVMAELVVRKFEVGSTASSEAALVDARGLLARIMLVRKKLRELHTDAKGKRWMKTA